MIHLDISQPGYNSSAACLRMNRRDNPTFGMFARTTRNAINVTCDRCKGMHVWTATLHTQFPKVTVVHDGVV